MSNAVTSIKEGFYLVTWLQISHIFQPNSIDIVLFLH